MSFFSLLLNIKTCLVFLSFLKKYISSCIMFIVVALFSSFILCWNKTIILSYYECVHKLHRRHLQNILHCKNTFSISACKKKKEEIEVFGTNRCSLHNCKSEIDVVCKTIKKQSREISGRNRTPPSGGRWNKATQNWAVWRCIKC